MIFQSSKGYLQVVERKNGSRYWQGRIYYRTASDCTTKEELKSMPRKRKAFILKEFNGKRIPVPTESRPNQGRGMAERALEAAKADFKAALEEEYSKYADPEHDGGALWQYAYMPIPDFVSYVIDRLEDGSIQEQGKMLEQSTISGYRSTLKHIRHYFPDVRVNELTSQMIVDFKADMARREREGEHIGKSLQRKIYNLMQQAYGYAERYDIIDKNPFRRTHTIATSKADPNPLTKESHNRLCAIINAGAYSPFTVAVKLALEAGLRQQEVCGLRWGDVDFEGHQLNIRNVVARTQGGTYTKSPKSAAGMRVVPLSDDLYETLLDWKGIQLRQFEKFKGAQGPEIYVIGDVDGGYYNPSILSREWRAYAKGCDLKGTKGKRATFHDLRDTFISYQLMAGNDVKTVSQMAGHADASVTLNVYADSLPSAKRDAIDKAAPLLWNNEPNEGDVFEFPKNGTEGR